MALAITEGERSDRLGFDEVLAQIPPDTALEDAVMDKGYDSHHIRATVKAHYMNPVIPPKSNRKDAIEYDVDTYKLRENVERFFKRLK